MCIRDSSLSFAGQIEADRGRLIEAASRFNRAYSLFDQNFSETPESLWNAQGRCRSAARIANLLSDSISEDERQLWKERAREHYHAIQWDDHTRAEYPELFDLVFSVD